MKLAFAIALRFLKSGKLQTTIIILGIAVGISVQVFIGSLISGLQKSLIEKTIGNSSQITISEKDNGYLDNYEQVIDTLQGKDIQIKAYLPTINQNGTIYKDLENKPIIVRSFDLNNVDDIYDLSSKVTEGEMPKNDGEILLGNNYKDLGISIGDDVVVAIPLKGNQELKVSGFFDFKVKTINDSWGVTSLVTGQNILGDNYVTQIETQINSGYEFSAREIAAEIENTSLSQSIVVTNWMDNNEELLSGLQGQSISSLMIQIFVVVSVVIGISSVLAIIVMQKSRQIGILKAMGIKDFDASLIFLFEGLILGVLGAIGGIVLGLGLSYSFALFALTSDGSPVVPLYIDVNFILISAAITIVASIIASLLPARKSSKLSVIEVIRNG